MLRRLFVLGIPLGCLLLVGVGRVEAQCTGYSITSTSVNVLSPTDAAAQGNVTATTTGKVLNVSGSMVSHKLTVTPGTQVGFNVLSNHGVSATASYRINGGAWQGTISQPLSGDVGYWIIPSSWVGSTYDRQYQVTDQNGDTTQDIVSITVVAGSGPSIVGQDGLQTNAYYQHVVYFGGGSMMNNCGECQGGETQKCLLATHTPLYDASMTNPQSGETQTISNAQAGNVAKATESVSGSTSIMISVLPGDHPTGTTTAKIYCTMFGWVMAQQWNPGIPDLEWAITEEETIPSSCTLVLRFFGQNSEWGVQCNVAWKKPPATADRCSAASQIPDFNPGAVWDTVDCKTEGDCGTADLPPPNGPNTSWPKYWYAASYGLRFGGPPSPDTGLIVNGGAHDWLFPIYVLRGSYVPGGPDEAWWILDALNIAVAKGTGLPIDCTNRDKGTSPIQSPW